MTANSAVQHPNTDTIPQLTDLEARQIALEQESLASGQKQYYERLAKKTAVGAEDTTAPAMGLIRRTVGVLSEGIATAIREQDEREGAGRRKGAIPLIRGLDADLLAYATLRASMQSISTESEWVKVSVRIGQSLMDEINFRKFKKAEPKTYEITQENLKKGTRSHYSGAEVMRHFFRNSSTPDPINWSEEQKAHVGGWLLDTMLVVCADLFEARIISGIKKNQTKRVLRATDTLAEFLSTAHDKMSLMAPIRLPMVHRPRDWEGPYDGGYLTDCGGRMALIKTRNRQYLDALQQADLSDVCEALNAMQSTAWRINPVILAVAKQCSDQQIAVGDLPNFEPDPVPPAPAEWIGRFKEWKAADMAGYKSWAQRAAVVHEANTRMVSKRKIANEQIGIAERFAAEAAIYFPHQLDFRGRAYAMPIHLQPQGTDLSKALLMFAEGKPLGARGVWWLKVHIANCFGVDKVAFEDRVAWTDSHLDQLLDSAIDPLGGDRFWTTAADPWQALAAATDLLGYSVNGEGHVSHLSIPMDGSCNGLQNFSALLRDAVGGKATNLVPSEKPADIYAEVARVVSVKVQADAEAGNEFAILVDGRITRSIVKQPVMTQPYGATRQGMRAQLEDAIRKNMPGVIPQSKSWGLSCYLSEIVYDSIGEVVIAARTAMDWLREVAKLAASIDLPIRWTTPIGLPVLQDYRERIGKQLRMHIDGKTQKVSINIDGDKLDRRRQTAGISPNLIHSYDAAHMMRTILIAKDQGIRHFSLIHDSYGTHACDTDTLHSCIREAFIEQYSGNLLEQFRNQLMEQLPVEAREHLPPIPEMGTLDLTAVRQSRYFFA